MGKVIVLSLLILALVGGGIVWFDYLNVIDVKTVLAPVYRLIGLEGRTQVKTEADDLISLDAERLTIRLEALELRERELNNREQEILTRNAEIEQMAQELEARQKALDDRENSFNAAIREAETKDRIVEQNARYLTGMDPENAVGILVAMDDQDAIDVIRKAEALAQAEGTTSIVAYWMSRMPAERAAELQRKMAGRPAAL
ncbi:MAG: flagellar protein FlbB [Treponema sp.]|jgi:flagellar protein FlbB|nr:flagellar protein FlbB [Treponema sp.]